MAGSLLSRVAARTRQALGVELLAQRLDGVEAGLRSVSDHYPYGPIYLGDHTALVAARWGGKLIVDTRDALLSPWLLLDGLWESHITGWLERHLQPGQTFVDVGANIGYFTVLAGRLVGPKGRVVAVEAHPALAELLRRNVIVNGQHGHTTVFHRAAWSSTDRLTFNQRDHFAANSSLGAADPDALVALGDTTTPVEVDAVALDDLLGDLPHLDVLKVDVEGAEVRAFTGLERTLHANPDITVLVEWSPEQLLGLGDSPAALLDLLVGHGFGFRLFEADLATVAPAQILDTPYGNLLAQR